MKKKNIKINTMKDMLDFISFASKTKIKVYKHNLEINGSSLLAMMTLIGEKIQVVYPITAASFRHFINKFSI